jgi:hypothetical protein
MIAGLDKDGSLEHYSYANPLGKEPRVITFVIKYEYKRHQKKMHRKINC